MKYIIVFITVSSQDEAHKIADNLVTKGLAACVNIIPKVTSVFMWQGKKEAAVEWLLIAKTKEGVFEELASTVKKSHSYETPEIIALPIVKGDENYLDWIAQAVKNK